jgi:hypothetical protein
VKRPSFQFYPADWKNNSKLRRCSEAARGAWVDVLCLLNDFDEYGVCRWPLAELARAAGVPIKLAKELVDKNVLKGADKGAPNYVFTPRHAGKDGEPVTLVIAGDGPCWYCTRFVRDEYIRQRRGSSSRFTSENQPPSVSGNLAPNTEPKPPFGARQGDGLTSTSTSTSKPTPTTPDGVVVASQAGNLSASRPQPAARPECPHQGIIALYHEILPECPQVRDWTPARAQQLRARWNEDPRRQTLDYWRKFFEYVKGCGFLVGRGAGDRPFVADLEWLTKSKNFTKIREGKYE